MASLDGNQILAQLAALPWPKVLLGGVLAAGVYYAALFNDGSSLEAQIQTTSAQLEEAKKQLKATQDAMANADKFEREVKALIQQYEGILAFMPSKFGTVELVTAISQVANQSGAKLVSTEPKDTLLTAPSEGAADAVDFYDTVKLDFVLQGNYADIVRFLSQLSRVPRLMTFEETEVSVPDDSGAAKASDAENPTLQFKGTVVAYRYKGDPKLNIEKAAEAPADPNAQPPAEGAAQ